MKKIFLFVCLALIIAVILFFSIPVPIVSHPDSSKIEWIMVNPDFGNPDSIPLDISISDDVEQEILEYLHQCTMRRKPFSDKRHFSLSRVAIYFSIGDSQNESLYCTLGTSDINRCSRGYDSTWYSIASPSPETILSDLRRILSNQ